MGKKYCWVWNVKPECVDEYVKIHAECWPTVRKAHSEAGLYDYSIFQNGNQFIYTFDCDGDAAEAFAAVGKDPEVIRWNAITGPMLDISDASNVTGQAVFLKEIFRLD